MSIDLTQRLKDRVAIITGGASGIGFATRPAVRRGGRLRRDRRRRSDDRRGGGRRGGRGVPSGRRRRPGQVDALFDGVAEEFGRIDIAFNNAGISPADDDSIETTELPAWDRVQDVNLKSVYLCSRAALRHMVPAGRGSIINTASFVALLGSGDLADQLHRVEGRRAGDVP